MSGYQRMISYLYRYEQGTKTANVGYARIEQQNGTCRITVQLQDTLSHLPEITFFIQQADGILTIPCGKLSRRRNGFGMRIETPSGQIMNTAYDFSEIDGIFLPVSDDIFYATTWKEIPFHADQVVRAGEETKARADASSDERPPVQSAEIAAQEGMQTQYDAASPAHSEQEDTCQAQLEKQELQEHPDTENHQKESRRNEPNPNLTEELNYAEKIITMFPKMYPFEIDTMGECVRLDLKDIGYLPVQHWSLAGNPFLLHGYYCYRHLIFTQMPEDGTHHGEYVVGVPGIYNQNNQLNSEECGFSGFQPLTDVPDLQGAFGYWLYEIA